VWWGRRDLSVGNGGIRRFADRIPWGWLVTRHHARAVRFARPVVASGFLEEFEPPRMTFGSFLRSFNSGVVVSLSHLSMGRPFAVLIDLDRSGLDRSPHLTSKN
jgi:hypothetical protein